MKKLSGKPDFMIVMLQNAMGKWYHHVISKNGEIVYCSGSYDNKKDCEDMVKAFCKYTGLTYMIKGQLKK